MHSLLDGYLNQVESYLGSLPPNIRQGEIEEMTSHLQQLRADFVAQGRTVEEAEKLALARFGSARKAGLRLRDVWEGNRGVWAVFFAVLLSNYTLLIGSMLFGVRFFTNPQLENQALSEALQPVEMFWMELTMFVLPLVCNFVLGRWGGRRAVLSALLVYLPLCSIGSARHSEISASVAGLSLHFSWLGIGITLLAVIGALSGSLWQRRQRLVLVGGALLEEASTRLRERQRLQRRRLLQRVSTCTLLTGLICGATFAITKQRVDPVLHPATPEAAVRVMLNNPARNRRGREYNEMDYSTNVSTRLLPATPEELAKNERRVFYTATLHASDWYRQERIAFLQKKLQAALEGRATQSNARLFRASIARLKHEGYTLSRTVRVRNTPDGWQVVESINAAESPTAWLYDVYYERR